MWYYASAGDYEGPFQEAYIGRKLRAGVITKNTLVWRDGMAEWLPLSQTKLIHLLDAQKPWQVPPPVPPASSTRERQEPQGQQQGRQERREPRERESEGRREQESQARRQVLEDYEQSGYERPQKGRPAPSQERSSEQGKSTQKGRQQPTAKAGAVQDLSSVTNVVCALFGLSALLSAFFLFQYINEGSSSHEPYAWSYAAAKPLLQFINLAGIAAGLTFLVWVYRAIENLPGLGARSLDLLPGWVVISFFIPILKVFIPYFALRKLWQASHAPREWTKQTVAPLLTFLWLAWIFADDDWERFIVAPHAANPEGVIYFYGDPFHVPSLWPFALSIAVDIMVILFVRAVWKAQREANQVLRQ